MSEGRAFNEKIDMAVFSAHAGFVRVSLRLRLPSVALPSEPARRYLASVADQARDSEGPAQLQLGAWREAYMALGLSDSVPPPEALMAWTKQPAGLPSQGALRDLVHAFMLEHGLPVAAYALSRTSGDLWLRPSRGSEHFVGLGRARPETPTINEVIFVDSAQLVLARHWHGAQARDSIAGPEDRDVLVHLDLLPPESDDSDRLAEELAALCVSLLGAEPSVQQLSWECSEIAWTARDGV